MFVVGIVAFGFSRGFVEIVVWVRLVGGSIWVVSPKYCQHPIPYWVVRHVFLQLNHPHPLFPLCYPVWEIPLDIVDICSIHVLFLDNENSVFLDRSL